MTSFYYSYQHPLNVMHWGFDSNIPNLQYVKKADYVGW